MADWNYTGLRFWFDMLQLLFTCGLALWVYISRAPRENKQAIAELEARLKKSEAEQEKLQVRLEYLPTKEELHQMGKELSGLASKLDSSAGRMKAIENKLDLLIENELRGNHAR
ncbi:DUF2730 family protein [Rheinheimera aquimaris]|uniref:DUF2730 family protein n=1 Tax=Rheinheimera aquimaris TaxID=412437 RepID=UPI001E2CFF85|nr:DUF2730 family protein [Rheinheimera aquimaris]MCD1597877.1 DUF2730 domain-containing protein [Rheinheimera aquimaris]